MSSSAVARPVSCERPEPGQLARLSCLDHDAQGEELAVPWEREVDAAGSGAFLVEACRYLGDALLRAWEAHGGLPEIPPDEDPVLFARRQVAQLCLYGVDKNPFAVDLAKLSLWLATLAKDHPFTFLDDALRHGDSLVGLSPSQIERFHWEEKGQQPLLAGRIRAAMDAAMERRAALETLNDEDHEGQEALLAEAEAALHDVLDAYGWTDLRSTCEFLLDYDVEDDDSYRTRQRKKPWSYRWPEDVRDEVLARLLALNGQRSGRRLSMAESESARCPGVNSLLEANGRTSCV